MAQIVIDSNSNLIQGDFDSATVNNRTKFQTSTPNANTGVYAIPNGTGTVAGFQAANNSDPTNASKIVMATNGSTDTQIISGVNGSGTYLPLSFYTNNALAAQIDTSGNLAVTGTVAGATGILYPIISGTAVTLTTQTSVPFTSIPSWVKRITVMFNGVSTNGTSNIVIRIGAGSVQTTGYLSACSTAANAATNVVIAATSGFAIESQSGASDIHNGQFIMSLLNSASNTWVFSGLDYLSNNTRIHTISGATSLSGTLDRVSITTVNGTDQFDAGTINILYE